MMNRIVDRAREVAARLRSPAALRLLAQVRRNPNAVLAALLGLGILLMVIHWSGSASAPPITAAHAQHAGDGGAAVRPPPAALP